MNARPTLFPLLLALLLPLAACGTARTIEGDSPRRFAHLNERGARQMATVTLADGRVVRALALQMGAGTTSWRDPGTGDVTTLPTSEVVGVRFSSRGKGASDGAAIGSVVGSVSGAVLGLAAWQPCGGAGLDCIMQPSGHGMAALLGGSVGVAAGALIGAAVGAARGATTTYLIHPVPIEPPPEASRAADGTE